MIPTTLKVTGAVMLTDELRSFIEEKVRKLEKVLDPNDSVVRADVEVGTVGARTGEQFRAEINVKYSGGTARAEATTDNLHSALDDAIEEARGEIRRARTKHRDLIRRGAARVKDLYRYWRGGK